MVVVDCVDRLVPIKRYLIGCRCSILTRVAGGGGVIEAQRSIADQPSHRETPCVFGKWFLLSIADVTGRHRQSDN